MKTTSLSASAQASGRGRSILRERRWARAAFTLTELLMVMMILALVSTMAATAFSGMMQQSRIERTRVVIRKIDSLLVEKWEGYRTRPIPIRVPVRRSLNGDTSLVTPAEAARTRLAALRQMQRMELPDRKVDIRDIPVGFPITNTPGVAMASPALRNAYIRNFANATGQSVASLVWDDTKWTSQYEGAECLYLIMANTTDGEKRALDFFSTNEIGDVDNDGMREILDGWGNPIEFLRWPAGFTQSNGAITSQVNDRNVSPDPFDPIRVDPRWLASPPLEPFAVRPLVYSAGPDKKYDINAGDLPNAVYDPYILTGAPAAYIGTPGDANGDGVLSFGDNITNHDLPGN